MTISPDPVSNGLSVQNAAEVTAYGMGLDVAFQVTDRLNIRLDSLFVRSSFDEFRFIDASRPILGIIDLSGNDLPQSPSYKITGGISYNIPMGSNEPSFHLQATTTDEFHTSQFNLDEMAAHSSTVVDASVGYDMANNFMVSL